MTFGFLGFGKMASALVQGMLQAGACKPEDILVINRHPETIKEEALKYGLTLASSTKRLVQQSDTIVLGTKPADSVQLLRDVFKRCAQQPKQLFDASSLLERRVGLVKFHGHRQAAHITLDSYLFHTWDLVHVVAAIAMIGAMIIDFDDRTRMKGYFDAVDEAAWQAATQTFPRMEGKRLFHDVNILGAARTYWMIEEMDGLNTLLNRLPAVIGYRDSANEVGS